MDKETAPKQKKSLLEVLASLEPLGENERMPEIEDLPPEDFEL